MTQSNPPFSANGRFGIQLSLFNPPFSKAPTSSPKQTLPSLKRADSQQEQPAGLKRKKPYGFDENLKKAVELYLAGKPIKASAKAVRIDEERLRKYLKKKNLLRTRQEAVRNGKGGGGVRDKAFDALTPECLYWIGFLYADGHIEKGRGRITLTLTGIDYSHLEKFVAFVGEKLTIRDVTPEGLNRGENKGFFRVAFSSKRIYEQLQELGFTHNKTYGIIPHESLKHSRDFWRGVVDGDGWIYQTGKYNYSVGLSGQEITIQEFINFLRRNKVYTYATARKEPRRNHLWTTEIRGRQLATAAARLLYEGATVYLDRKYEKYMTGFQAVNPLFDGNSPELGSQNPSFNPPFSGNSMPEEPAE